MQNSKTWRLAPLRSPFGAILEIQFDRPAAPAEQAREDYQNALLCHSEELKIAKATLHDYEAELAYAYHDAALANHMLGRSAEAAQAYTKAEQILPVAAQRIHMDGLDKRRLTTLKRVQQEHLILLKQAGDTAGAATLQKQSGRRGQRCRCPARAMPPYSAD
jgi:hypothetical protein